MAVDCFPGLIKEDERGDHLDFVLGGKAPKFRHIDDENLGMGYQGVQRC